MSSALDFTARQRLQFFIGSYPEEVVTEYEDEIRDFLIATLGPAFKEWSDARFGGPRQKAGRKLQLVVGKTVPLSSGPLGGRVTP